MKIKVDGFVSVYYDTEDRKLYCLVEFVGIDNEDQKEKVIVCISEGIE